MGARPVKEKRCQLCNAVMKDVDIRRKYCPACLSTVRRMQAEESNKKLAARRKAAKSAKSTLPQGDSIHDVCARAQAAGRSYGQQVAFERQQKEKELKQNGKNDQK